MGEARHRRLGAAAVLVLLVAAAGVAVAAGGSSRHRARLAASHRVGAAHPAAVATAAAAPGRPRAQAARPRAGWPRAAVVAKVRIVTVRVIDPIRTIGRVKRSFVTVIRIPSGARGPFPLIVFGHGYAVTPTPYAPLLDAWTKAGYVVAAPVFPLENANAPGGPNENDLPNQPRDMSLVIDRLLGGSLGRVVRHHRIAVSGQSDGGDTALAAAFDPRVRDPRVSAAVILSGAYDPFISRFAMPLAHVPLLATQGTADTINPPWMTYQFYDPATPPRFLLKLIGQGHLPPYTQPGVTLNTVVRGTTAFLNCYLKSSCARWNHFRALGTAGTPSVLTGR